MLQSCSFPWVSMVLSLQSCPEVNSLCYLEVFCSNQEASGALYKHGEKVSIIDGISFFICFSFNLELYSKTWRCEFGCKNPKLEHSINAHVTKQLFLTDVLS